MLPHVLSKRSSFAFCAGIAFIVLLQLGPAVFASTELSEGMRFYNKGEYLNALAALNRAAALEPNNALAHYYLANTLLYVSNREEAMEEYKVAYSLSAAHSQMARYCMLALQAEEQRQAEEEGKQMNKQLLRQMVTQIQAQLDQHKKGLKSSAQAHSSHRARMEDQEERRIQEQADREIEDLANNPIPVVVGRRVQYIPRTEEMHAVRERASRMAHNARERAERGVSQAMNESAARQAELERAATNLESQFLRPSSNGVRLDVLGTNLYVRNYVSSKTPAQDEQLPVPLVATAKRLKWLPLKRGTGGNSAGTPEATADASADDRGNHKKKSSKNVTTPVRTPVNVPAETSRYQNTSSTVHGKFVGR